MVKKAAITWCPSCGESCTGTRGYSTHLMHHPSCFQEATSNKGQSFAKEDSLPSNNSKQYQTNTADLQQTAHKRARTVGLMEQLTHNRTAGHTTNEYTMDIGNMDDDGDVYPPDDNEYPFEAIDLNHETAAKTMKDTYNGVYTTPDKLNIELLKLLRDIKAPLYAFDKIMTLFSDAANNGHTVTPDFPKRATVMKTLFKRFGLNSLQPTVKTIPSPETPKAGVPPKRYTIVLHEFIAMLYSLLNHPSVMNDKTMLFPNPDDPLAEPLSEPEYLGDFETGRCYYVAYTTLCTARGQIICPIIFYIDKIAIDKTGHLCLEPVYFTLGLINLLGRLNPLAWRPLGYIPNIGLKSKAESHNNISGPQKVQLYHDILMVINESLVKIQQLGGLPWSFVYKGSPYHVILHFPVLVNLGDTEAHDKQCGRKVYRNSTAIGLCRHCDCPYEESSNPYYEGHLLQRAKVEKLMKKKDIEGLADLMLHYIHNAYHNGICLGNNPRGIFGITPSEVLHMIELGLDKYLIEGFFCHLGYNKKNGYSPRIVAVIDAVCRHLGQVLKHQSDRDLPRTYFHNGV